MTAVAVEITPRARIATLPPLKAAAVPAPVDEPDGFVIENVDTVTRKSVPGCNDDNPYR
ncbi:hypothetical protein ABT160_25085 [Streptomyces sp. NPDC001941]|uniref:hypothetical protein n=1 Tax=Streptomyces sp. NPDC001941 TaxID=3154659 RepID=UPI0033179EAB